MTLPELIQKGREAASKYGGRGNTRGWVEEKDFAAMYLRYGSRYLNQKLTFDVLEIANITVEPDKQGTGVFTRFVSRVRKEYPRVTLYVESVLEPRFGQKLLKMGFDPVNENPDSYVLPTTKELR